MTAATMTEHAPFRADQVGSLLRPPELKASPEPSTVRRTKRPSPPAQPRTPASSD